MAGAPQPRGPKLIEVALPLRAINEASIRDMNIRLGHPANLHLWWARRPLPAARAVLWSSLVDDPLANPEKFPTTEEQILERKRLLTLLERLVMWERNEDPTILSEARAEVEACRNGGGGKGSRSILWQRDYSFRSSAFGPFIFWR